MTDRIYVFDGSRKLHIRTTLNAIGELQKFRDIEFKTCSDPAILRSLIHNSYDPRRGQVNSNTFMQQYSGSKFEKSTYCDGKIIILDEDIYNGHRDNNWVFGGLSSWDDQLGTILLSTARLANEDHAQDIIKHELGHMFRAPSKQRTDTYECLGLHCTNPSCIMHQEVDLNKSIKKSNDAAPYGGIRFCNNCAMDVRRFKL